MHQEEIEIIRNNGKGIVENISRDKSALRSSEGGVANEKYMIHLKIIFVQRNTKKKEGAISDNKYKYNHNNSRNEYTYLFNDKNDPPRGLSPPRGPGG